MNGGLGLPYLFMWEHLLSVYETVGMNIHVKYVYYFQHNCARLNLLE